MENTEDGAHFQHRMKVTFQLLAASLSSVVDVVVARHKAYFRPSLCKMLHIPNELQEEHAQLVRDYKVICRRFCLILKKLDGFLPGELTIGKMRLMQVDMASAWRDLDDIEFRNYNMIHRLAYIDKHLASVQGFLDDMSEEMNQDDDPSDSGVDNYFDSEDNRDYPF